MAGYGRGELLIRLKRGNSGPIYCHSVTVGLELVSDGPGISAGSQVVGEQVDVGRGRGPGRFQLVGSPSQPQSTSHRLNTCSSSAF